MQLVCSLANSLLVLLLGVPAITCAFPGNSTAATDNRTSPIEPFREIRLHSSSKPSDPVCCLIPLSTEPLPTSAEFLSFEEWKSKQRELQAQATNQTSSPDASIPDAMSGPSSATPSTAIGDLELATLPPAESTPALSPHFRVPLTDRFNYASLDCSARVHTSHKSARSPSAILSSKKDKYMLSPCSADPNFVVVELCDDIRIDTVQLANFEFFSAVFRDFKVSVAQTYTSDGQEWIEAGTYRAKNIRSVQSFHPLVELRPFYRFIRIDFLSHYGNEFYCPVSLLRVYGLTQMEEWKWEVWQSGAENIARPLPEGDAGIAVQENVINVIATPANGTKAVETEPVTLTANETMALPGVTDQDSSDTDNSPSNIEVYDSVTKEKHSNLSQSTQELATPSSLSNLSISLHIVTTSITPSDSSISLMESHEIPSVSTSATVTLSNTANTTLSNVTSLTSMSHVTSSIQTIVALPSPSAAPSGESIYRTIMNRLSMLEANTTLYQKYVQEQTLQVREALRRLEEDVGRLEGISKAQNHVFAKTMNELEIRRRQMEEERWELLNKVNALAAEVTLEKRLGIAQLSLLLAVLVFMALTRGSRADATSFLDGTVHRINSFSRLSHWPSMEPRKRSPTPTPKGLSTEHEPRSVLISSPSWERGPLSSVSPPRTPPARPQTPRTHLRRPSTPRHHDITRLTSSERPSGRLRRSNSHTMPANAVLSAKHFARTAHLHEVQPSARSRQKGNQTRVETRSEGEDGLNIEDHDGSPKPIRDNGKEAVRLLQDTVSLPAPIRSSGAAADETESSWVDTEPGSDPDASDSSEDEQAGQEVRAEINYQDVPLMKAPPPTRRLESHTPASPASVVG